MNYGTSAAPGLLLAIHNSDFCGRAGRLSREAASPVHDEETAEERSFTSPPAPPAGCLLQREAWRRGERLKEAGGPRSVLHSSSVACSSHHSSQ
jgi:hypothetical protein